MRRWLGLPTFLHLTCLLLVFFFHSDCVIIYFPIIKMGNRAPRKAMYPQSLHFVTLAGFISAICLLSIANGLVITPKGVIAKAAILTGPAHIGVPSACFQKVDPGPCGRDIVRIYYDYKTYTCKSFSYSGCGGNMNRFVSVKNCYKLCHPYYRQRPADVIIAAGTTPASATTGAAAKTTAAAAAKTTAAATTRPPPVPPQFEVIEHINTPQQVPQMMMPYSMPSYMPYMSGMSGMSGMMMPWMYGMNNGYSGAAGGGNEDWYHHHRGQSGHSEEEEDQLYTGGEVPSHIFGQKKK